MTATVSVPNMSDALPWVSESQIIPLIDSPPQTRWALASKNQHCDTLYQQHHAELTAYLQGKWGKSQDEAKDITHQAFERLLSVAEPSSIQQPRAYLFQLIKNLVIDGLRRDKVRAAHALREQVEGEPVGPEDGLQSLLSIEQLQMLQTVIEKMPGKRRRAFVLNRVYQLSYKEIADEMDISIDGVKKHILRALETCREQLKQRFDE